MEVDWIAIDWNFEKWDIFKAFLSLIFGFILGLEREMKDKAAGLRTITIISLGSTLFTLMSYKIGLETGTDTTRIASYVVSGIGFLGAGVIFKDGISINGLTTASIIWVAAAIGMSIGFGQFSSAIIFLVTSLLIIHLGKWFNIALHSKYLTRTLELKFKNELNVQQQILSDLSTFCIKQTIKQQIKENEFVTLYLDVKIKLNQNQAFIMYLLQNQTIEFFKL